MSNVAFVGLGMMGLPMAHNILKGGHSVTGFDLSSDAMKHHEANGGSVTSTAAKAVEDAEFIITMVPKGEHVISALFGPDGIVEGMSSNSMIIDMSTIHPLDTDSIRKELSSKGISMLDAPVGRTSDHAKLGKLLVMVGGEKDDIERARPVLDCMGDTIVDCGGPGMGARMKIINNYMSISLNALTAEALALAESTGLEIPLAIEVMSGTLAGQGHMSNSYPAKVLKGDLSPAFMLDLAHKDLGLALDLANDLRVPMPLGAAAREVYSVARGHDRGAQDWTALYETVREISGLNK